MDSLPETNIIMQFLRKNFKYIENIGNNKNNNIIIAKKSRILLKSYKTVSKESSEFTSLED